MSSRSEKRTYADRAEYLKEYRRAHPQPEHDPIGDPCAECGLDSKYHRKRSRGYRPQAPSKRGCLGVDGEGFEAGSVYGYMACASAKGLVSSAENVQGNGLSTWQCLEFLLDLPKKPIKFGFSLGYDYTKILADLDNETLWKLCRPEERLGKKGPPMPVWWQGNQTQYGLNLLGNRLTVMRLDAHRPDCVGGACIGCKVTRQVILWDVFKFFQSSFITACKAWGVIDEAQYKLLKVMKGKRPDFARPKSENDEEWLEIKRYCVLECQKMAELAQRLLTAHDEAGLKLKQYFGAGSTGAAMLERMKAKSYIRVKRIDPVTKKVSWRRPLYDPYLQDAIARAFFGGRFEISRRGPVRERCWSYDISSAYPYAFTFLPCLVHGSWEYHNWSSGLLQSVKQATAALVQYRLPYHSGIKLHHYKDWTSDLPWGPFPFRTGEKLDLLGKGNIVFPVTSGGGWLWRDEFLAGYENYPNVVATAAWIYNTHCKCRVLRDVMPLNYRTRVQWGKEGKGIVSKLGQNSCYGKTAQTKGRNPPFQEFVWAGITTSNCRAQLTKAIAMACSPKSILMLATDGIVSTERLTLEKPRDTGTSDLPKPLGGWEEKELEEGLFLIRPGIAFPLKSYTQEQIDKEEDEKETKARGVGKAVLKTLRQTVLQSWEERGPETLQVPRPMFFGMKSQARRVGNEKSGYEYRRSERFGRFADQDQSISFNPLPKRPCIDSNERFMTHALPQECLSDVYGPILGKPKVISDHLKTILEEKELEQEQPDADEYYDEKEF
jgi:hypothetical protein